MLFDCLNTHHCQILNSILNTSLFLLLIYFGMQNVKVSNKVIKLQGVAGSVIVLFYETFECVLSE